MKSAYELAMERLNKISPTVKLTDDQKRRIAELEAEYKAKLADREIAMRNKIEQAKWAGDDETVSRLESEWAETRKTLLAELDAKKEKIRQENTGKKAQ
jgi:hypothetical protein